MDLLGLQFTWLTSLLTVCGVITILFLLGLCIINKNHVLLSYRNVLRNKRRSVLTLLAVAFAFASNVLLGAYFLDMFNGLRESTIRSQTGHVQIFEKGFFDFGSSAPNEYLIENYDEILSLVEADEVLSQMIEVSMKELRFNGIITAADTGRSLSYIGRGVDLEQDKILSGFDIYIAGQGLRGDRPYDIVLGEGLVRQLKAEVGDSVTLLGSTYDGGINVLDANIGGSLRSFSREYSNVVVKTSLDYAQDMLATDAVNKLVFLLYKTEDTALAKERLENIIDTHPEWNLEVYDWLEISEFYTQVRSLFSTIYVIVSSLLFSLIIFLVLNTMTMSIMERFGEFGTLRTIGLKRSDLILLVLGEGAILGILGALLGIVLSYGLGEFITSLNIVTPPSPGQTTGYPINLSIYFSQWTYMKLILISFFSVIGITALSTLTPAIRVAKLKIIEAIHTV